MSNMRLLWCCISAFAVLRTAAGGFGAQRSTADAPTGKPGLAVPEVRLPNWNPGVDGGIPDVAVQVNARDAGAVGDGKADDTRAIQKAIDGIKPPGAVLLPAGTYLVTGQLSLRSGVVLRGEGRDRTHIRCVNPKTWTAVVRIAGGAGREETPLKSGYEAGSTKLVTAKPSGIREGQFFVILSDNPMTVPSWTNRPLCTRTPRY